MSGQHVLDRAEPHHIGAGIYSVRTGDQCFAAYLTEANARRVSACLNACNGISTADLEGADRMLSGKAVQEWLDSHNAKPAVEEQLEKACGLLYRVFQADVLAGDFDEEIRVFLAESKV